MSDAAPAEASLATAYIVRAADGSPIRVVGVGATRTQRDEHAPAANEALSFAAGTQKRRRPEKDAIRTGEPTQASGRPAIAVEVPAPVAA